MAQNNNQFDFQHIVHTNITDKSSFLNFGELFILNLRNIEEIFSRLPSNSYSMAEAFAIDFIYAVPLLLHAENIQCGN